jgi:hypothetical protein
MEDEMKRRSSSLWLLQSKSCLLAPKLTFHVLLSFIDLHDIVISTLNPSEPTPDLTWNPRWQPERFASQPYSHASQNLPDIQGPIYSSVPLIHTESFCLPWIVYYLGSGRVLHK